MLSLKSSGKALFVLAILCPALQAQKMDQLVPLKGTPIAGIVTAMTPTEVTINVRGTDQKVSVLEIKRLTYGDEPRELGTARDHMLSSEWQAGLEQVKKIDVASIDRDYVKQDLEFYSALGQAQVALSAGGDKEAATEALMKYARGAPKNYHFIEVAGLLGRLAIEREKYDDASRFYGFLAKTAREANWPEFALEVAAMEARVLEAQGKFTEALAKYDTIIAANVDSPEATRQKNLATIGKAGVYSETEQAEEGVKLVEQIVQKNDPKLESELFGRAYNAQGRCYIKLNKSLEATLAFLRVDLLFPQHPDIHAEALHYLSKLWAESNKNDRAAAVHSVLAQRYAGSRWAKK
jgi:tetratricopeptide (TPR) repeat protein